MSWGRAPWWLYVAAAPFVAYAAVACWLLAWGPRPHGIRTDYCDETICVVSYVGSGSAAEAAGLVPGDVVEAWDGRPAAGWRVWRRIERSWTETHTLTIARSGQKLTLQLDLGRRPWRHWTTLAGIGELVSALSALLTIGLALVVAFTRPRDSNARRGALFMATLGCALFTFGPWVPPGFSYAVGHLPLGLAVWPILGCALAVGTMCESSLAWAVSFPRPLFRSRWLWGLLWLPALVRVPDVIC